MCTTKLPNLMPNSTPLKQLDSMSIITQYTIFNNFIACPPLTAPNNGDIDCLLGDDGQPSLGDTCTFTCDDGYKLSSSVVRSCQIDGNWSGNDALCSLGMLLDVTFVYHWLCILCYIIKYLAMFVYVIIEMPLHVVYCSVQYVFVVLKHLLRLIK